MACELTGVGLAPVGLLLARRLCGVCALPRVHVCTYSRTCVCGEDGVGSEDGPRWLVRGHAWACAYAYAYACACAMRCTGMQCRRSGNLSVPARAIAEPADPAAVSWASPPANAATAAIFLPALGTLLPFPLLDYRRLSAPVIGALGR